MPDASNPESAANNPVSALGAGVEVVAQTLPCPGVRAGQRVTINVSAAITQGAAAGSITLRVRRNTLTGALVSGQGGFILAIAELKSLSILVVDSAANDDPVYVFTIQDTTAATLNQNGIMVQPSN